MAHRVGLRLEAHAREQRRHGLPVGEHACAVGLDRGHDDVVHQGDFVAAREARLGFVERGLGPWGTDPLLVAGEPRLEVADALQVFVEFVLVGGAETAAEIAGVFQGVVEDASPLPEERLLLFERRRLLGKQAVERLEGIPRTAHRLAPRIPGE